MGKAISNKLSYSDFNKKLLKDEISPVYMFTGDQVYLMNQAVEELKKKVLGASADFNFSLFYGDSTSAQDISNSAKTYPMLSKRFPDSPPSLSLPQTPMRMVLVKNAEKLPAGELKLLGDYISSPSPSTCLVLMFTEEKRLDLGNGGHVIFVDFVLNTKDITQTVREETRKLGYDITKEACETLVSLLGEDLQDIQPEIQKLTLFAGDRKMIDVEDVEKLTEKAQFADVFQLINAIAEKNKKRALKVLLELESTNEDPLSTLNKISWRFRLIWKAKELMDKKTPQNVILKELRVSSGALYYIKQQANNFHYSDIERISSILYEGDKDLKTSYIPKNLNLTKLVLKLCG